MRPVENADGKNHGEAMKQFAIDFLGRETHEKDPFGL